MLLPALMSAREQARRKSCLNNLGQIGKACISYQEPNADYFPAFLQQATNQTLGTFSGTLNGVPYTGTMVIPSFSSGAQGSDGTFQPMPSLACLYPTYCPEVKVFACPSTTDTPQIAFQYYNISPSGARCTPASGSPRTIPPARTSAPWTRPRTPATKSAPRTNAATSMTSSPSRATSARTRPWPRMPTARPGSCPAAGTRPTPIRRAWQRQPRKPNHDNGQNVMYLDGHVKWTDTVYCSHDPADNIFCPNSTAASSGTRTLTRICGTARCATAAGPWQHRQ